METLFRWWIAKELILRFVFLGLVLSLETAGIKGAGIVMAIILLQTMNLPLTLVPVLATIWPLIDIAHTTCNVTGDLVGTAIISSHLNDIDRDVFSGVKG